MRIETISLKNVSKQIINYLVILKVKNFWFKIKKMSKILLRSNNLKDCSSNQKMSIKFRVRLYLYFTIIFVTEKVNCKQPFSIFRFQYLNSILSWFLLGVWCSFYLFSILKIFQKFQKFRLPWHTKSILRQNRVQILKTENWKWLFTIYLFSDQMYKIQKI